MVSGNRIVSFTWKHPMMFQINPVPSLLLEHSRAEDPRTKALIAARAGAFRVSKLFPVRPFLVSIVFSLYASRLIPIWQSASVAFVFDDRTFAEVQEYSPSISFPPPMATTTPDVA